MGRERKGGKGREGMGYEPIVLVCGHDDPKKLRANLALMHRVSCAQVLPVLVFYQPLSRFLLDKDP